MAKTASRTPSFRKLRAYAFDPSLSLKIDTAGINDLNYQVPWEPLDPGPVGEYIEIIDYDPTIQKFYSPVNLGDPYILSEGGLPPSESNPHFHQQMVYAVTMTTIRNFERALGRKVLWATRLLEDKAKQEEYVPKLRIYPHALREANAYYSPVKKALLFGYFLSSPSDASVHMPDSFVFTCLSHDIIAHEVTHAILDGIHRNYNRPTNPDVLAFHEAFADIVALFQHFTFPEVLKHQIRKTRGDLTSQNLLGQLAQELGSAIGGYGSLRDALGEIDPLTKQWKPTTPKPDDYKTHMEPHSRGSILVAAVFEAFLTIYKHRIADLLRIATNGTGILPQGELHPDLVNRLAAEASKSAGHILNMCIRALDYCPPVDITFGEYLRAIITADTDLIVNDNRAYRLAFIDAFRKRGIYPENIKTLSIESLTYDLLDFNYELEGDNDNFDYEQEPTGDDGTAELLRIICGFLREYGNEIKYVNDRRKIYEKTHRFINGRLGLHNRLQLKFSDSVNFSELTGLVFLGNFQHLGLKRSRRSGSVPVQIENLRLVTRVGPNGNQVNNVIFSIIQESGYIIKDGEFAGHYIPDDEQEMPDDHYLLQGGCTLIFDLDTLVLKYAINKPLLDTEKLQTTRTFEIDKKRMQAQYYYREVEGPQHMGEHGIYFNRSFKDTVNNELFALLHQH